MSKQTEALKLALEALEYIHEGANNQGPHTGISWRCVSNKAEPAITAIREALAEQPAQQQEPVAYDKTELNCFAQDLYDQKMREGKHGHYESMFHVIHQCIKKVAPPANKPLTDEEIDNLPWGPHEGNPMTFAEGLRDFARAIEAKLREKNA